MASGHTFSWVFTKSNIYQSREKATIKRESQKMSNLHSPQAGKALKKHQLLITIAQKSLLLSVNSFSGLLHGTGFKEPSFPFLKNLKGKVKSEFFKNAFEWKKKNLSFSLNIQMIQWDPDENWQFPDLKASRGRLCPLSFLLVILW